MTAKVHTVFAAANTEELAGRYDDWAASYDSDMGDHGGPREAADTVKRLTANPDARILDAGCGTGLGGLLLASRGFRNLEGIDLSAGMLREAEKKDCYRALHQATLGSPLDFPSGSFDAVMAVGVFVHSHAPSRSLEELARITKPGGHVIFTLRPEFYVSTDFKDTMGAMTQSGIWRHVETSAPFSGRFREFPEVDLQVWVFERRNIAPAEWNETGLPYPSHLCIHHLFEEQAARTPEATALMHEDREFSYDALNRRANQVAHRLIGLGVGPETLVGVCHGRTPEMLIGILGILKAGGAYVPIDPAYPKVRQAFIMEETAVPVLITEGRLAANIPAAQATLLCLDREANALAQLPDANPRMPRDSRDLVCLLYTSGSTGRPKGVALEHRGVVNHICWARAMFSNNEMAGMLMSSSICFDISMFEIFGPLSSGGAIVLSENILAVPTLAARDRITFINTVPSALSTLIGIDGVPSGVGVITTAGELMSAKLMQDVHRLGTVGRLYNMWGPCETTIHSSIFLTAKGATKNPPIGTPLPNEQFYIVDEESRQVPIGVTGEIWVGGDGVARGYFKNPDLTDSKFIPNPFGVGRLYRTGDLARFLPDGNVEFVGRMGNQVKIRGFRIELDEIETVLEQHEAVKRAVVLALPDSRGDKQLVAYVVADPDAAQAQAGAPNDMDQVEIWQDVFDQTYTGSVAPSDPTLNLSGWHSSYTGQPIPEPEMREWVKQTVDRILALRPQTVLELGCGTGMLAVRIAPHCEAYAACDISEAGLNHIRSLQQTLPGLEGVSLHRRAAHELSGFELESFDVVVINSVIQLFPGIDYLQQVLTGVLPLMRPGGCIVLGDLINHATLETFQTSLQLHRARDRDSVGQVKLRIMSEVSQERDLALSPAIFPELARQFPSITHFEAIPKRGVHHNELTGFRYDAFLHIAKPVPTITNLVWTDWNEADVNLEELRRILLESQPKTLAIRNIPNGRLDAETAARPWLREAAAGEWISALRQYMESEPKRGVDPEDLWAFEKSGYRVEISWLRGDPDGSYDVVFVRDDQPAKALFQAVEGTAARPLGHFCNHPGRAKLNRELIPKLREFMHEKLPHYMMPAVFTVLDSFPLSRNGKIDRKALEQLPVTVDAAPETGRVVTDNPLELMLLEAWADSLGLSHVGLDQDFFELGGNSLKAVSLTHRLQKQLNRPIRPAALMQAPTVAKFAAYLEKAQPEMAAAAAAGGGPSPELEEGEI